MGKLLDYLKAAEVSLHSKLGLWRQVVSAALDGLLDPSYVLVRRATTDQTVDFSAEDDVVCNVLAEDGGIDYDTATGVFTLAEAGLYELEFYGTWTNFGTPNATAATVQWVDVADAPLETGFLSWVVSATGTQNTGSQPVAKVLYQAAAGAQVKVKASTAGGGGTADLLRGSSYALARKVA